MLRSGVDAIRTRARGGNRSRSGLAAGHSRGLPSNHGGNRAVKHDIAKRKKDSGLEIVRLPQRPDGRNTWQDIDDEDEQRRVVSRGHKELTGRLDRARERTHVHSPVQPIATYHCFPAGSIRTMPERSDRSKADELTIREHNNGSMESRPAWRSVTAVVYCVLL